MIHSDSIFKPICVSVQAKIMLVEEYAVMEGYNSLSLALNKKLHVTISETRKSYSQISSSLWKKPFIFSG